MTISMREHCGVKAYHTVTDAAGNITKYTYNAVSGLLESQENASGKKTYYVYNDRGQITNIFGDTTYPIEQSYNAYGQQVAQKTYRGGTGWNGSAWPLSTTGDADITTWTYDESSGLQTAKTFADGNSIVYTYTSDGKLLTRAWARTSGGNPLLTTYGYDANTGEQTSIDYSDSTTDITFSYTRAGQQAQITDAAGTRIFAYNAALQPTTETINGLYSRTITRNYAASGVAGRYTGFGVDSGHNKAVGYDNLGRLNTVARGSDAFAYSFVANSNLVANIAKPGNLYRFRL